jgi:hypothetical protein
MTREPTPLQPPGLRPGLSGVGVPPAWRAGLRERPEVAKKPEAFVKPAAGREPAG